MKIRQPALETLLREGRKFNLRHVEPRSFFRRVVRLKSLHSDTLFGALAWALRLVWGPERPIIVDDLLKEPNITFSSVFPFVRKKDGALLFFFPRPLAAPPAPRENDKDRKEFAGWKLASLEVFHHLINGEVTEEQIREDFCTHSSSATNGDATVDKNYVCLDKKYLLTRKEYREIEKVWRSARLFAETDLTRTRIDRRSGGAAEGKLFFTQEVLTTDEHSGYFFLIRASQEIWQKWEEPLAAALAFLADRGLGGDISAGRGKLKDLRIEGFTGLREPGEPTRFVTLSLYSPKKGLDDLRSDHRRAFVRGEIFPVTLLLIGQGIAHLDSLVSAFMIDGGTVALDRQQLPFRVRAVETLQADGSAVPYFQDNTRVGEPVVLTLAALSRQGVPQVTDHLTVEFLTPLALKHDNVLVRQAQDFSFPLLLRAVLRRLYDLAATVCGYRDAKPDFASLLALVDTVERTHAPLQWVDFPRFSSRQQSLMDFGGLVGRIGFRGKFAPLLSYLLLGAELHIGRHTSFGFGRFRCVFSALGQLDSAAE